MTPSDESLISIVFTTRTKPAKPRVSSLTPSWNTTTMLTALSDHDKQKNIIQQLVDLKRQSTRPHEITPTEETQIIDTPTTKTPITASDISPECIIAFSEIQKKRHGYIAQDKKHKRVYVAVPTPFDIIGALHSAQMLCYYCKSGVKILYEHKLNKKQWTLDRIDNGKAHDMDNVVISCLACNVDRRCQNSNKYKLAKQYTSIRLVDEGDKNEFNPSDVNVR